MPTPPNLIPLRADIKKTPGRVVFQGQSMYSKLNVPIERILVHELFPVGTDAAGELDYRDREAYARVRITPDGRFISALAAILWPYGNYTAGQVIFTPAVDNQLVIHATDGSLETFSSAALEVMPPIKFAATETLVGQAEFLCLRGDGQQWNAGGSAGQGLVFQQDAQESMPAAMADATFTPAGILTGPYAGVWPATGASAPVAGITLSPFDTLEGITIEFGITWSDDNRQSVGLQNRRIKTVSCRARCTPLGQLRESILAAEVLQGTGAIRGRSIQSNAADFQIVDYNGNVFMTLKNAALVEDKENWSSDLVRETDLVWQSTRAFTAGVVGPLFTVLS
jgi:hypothetical protein